MSIGARLATAASSPSHDDSNIPPSQATLSTISKLSKLPGIHSFESSMLRSAPNAHLNDLARHEGTVRSAASQAPGKGTLTRETARSVMELHSRAHAPEQIGLVVAGQDPRNALATEIAWRAGFRAPGTRAVDAQANQRGHGRNAPPLERASLRRQGRGAVCRHR